MKYSYALVLVLLMTSGCSRQDEAALSVSQLTSYLTTQQPTCQSVMTVGGGIKYSCGAQ